MIVVLSVLAAIGNGIASAMSFSDNQIFAGVTHIIAAIMFIASAIFRFIADRGKL